MKSAYDQIWETALRKLETRMHSKKELADKLAEKHPADRGLILKVIEELERLQLISDRRFAEEYVHHLTQKPIGRLKIMAETRRKGLPDSLVEASLLEQDWSETESIQRAIEEKERHLEGLEPRKKKEKLVNFLRNRGFSDRVIFSGLTTSD